MLTPKESGEHIVKNAKFLRVVPQGIDKIAKEVVTSFNLKQIDAANFSQHELHPKPTDAFAVEWIFVVDTLNFCFWTTDGCSKYEVNGYTGYFALCAAINRAVAEGIDIINPEFYANINEETLKRVFRSDDGQTVIPLLNKRLECLHQVGQRLLENWEGKFENVVKAAKNSAVKLLQLIVEEFDCFRDEAVFAEERVSIYKRAQILIGDLWSCFQSKDLGFFYDIEQITMFADYRVPQVLVYFGSLEYSPELLEVLRRDELLKNGDAMEVEIRGASIFIVEQVKLAVKHTLEEKKGLTISNENINSILIDHFLWDYRRKHAMELQSIPYHKVRCIYY